MLDGIIVLFLPKETHGVGASCSRLNPYRGKADNLIVYYGCPPSAMYAI